MRNEKDLSGAPEISIIDEPQRKEIDEGVGQGELLPKVPSDNMHVETALSTEIKHTEDEETERTFRRKRLVYFATLCFCFFFEGWSDGSFGPLLPRLQSAYGVRVPPRFERSV